MNSTLICKEYVNTFYVESYRRYPYKSYVIIVSYETYVRLGSNITPEILTDWINISKIYMKKGDVIYIDDHSIYEKTYFWNGHMVIKRKSGYGFSIPCVFSAPEFPVTYFGDVFRLQNTCWLNISIYDDLILNMEYGISPIFNMNVKEHYTWFNQDIKQNYIHLNDVYEDIILPMVINDLIFDFVGKTCYVFQFNTELCTRMYSPAEYKILFKYVKVTCDVCDANSKCYITWTCDKCKNCAESEKYGQCKCERCKNCGQCYIIQYDVIYIE